MISYKILLVLNEGLIFGLFAIGIYIAFQWLRFPDLTPDGSFVFGAVVFTKLAQDGNSLVIAMIASIISGIFAGLTTAILNRIIKIPTVVAGLLTSTALYSISWLYMGKPNQFLDPKNTLVNDLTGISASFSLFLYLGLISLCVIFFLYYFSETIWGFKIRAIGENPLLSRDFGSKELLYTILGLSMANGTVALAGAFFAQRSFSADINMGVGQTIVGLIGMILGLILSRKRRKILYVLIFISIGAILHKTIIMITLEAGLPAESFRLISALFFIVLFFILKATGEDFLKGLKWS